MQNSSHEPRSAILHMGMSEFWSGDLGLTLITISLVILIFVVFPLREAGLPGRIFFYLMIVTLMILGALAVNQSRMATAFVIVVVLVSSVVLVTARLHPTQTLHELGSVLSTVALLLYVRIVLLVMFRGGPVTWSRIQGAVCAYFLIGLAWGSAYELLEDLHPGSFRFISAPSDIDQLTSKLTYFSFSTLTTVGFGDITPLNPFARSLSTAEAIVGQLFPAILIGALVAMAMQSHTKS
jgi:Ion channel